MPSSSDSGGHGDGLEGRLCVPVAWSPESQTRVGCRHAGVGMQRAGARDPHGLVRHSGGAGFAGSHAC